MFMAIKKYIFKDNDDAHACEPEVGVEVPSPETD